MPEGPSIVLVKEDTEQFIGKKIISVRGNSKIDQSRLVNQNILAIKTWGKHYLICFKGFTLKIHFMMFGSYRVNEKKENPVRLNLTFEKGEINFYNCSVKYLEGDVNDHYDWSADVMNDEWNARKAKAKLKEQGAQLICDALLEQDIFSGVGNIIKNEVLYRVRIHPESILKKIPTAKINKLIAESRIYSFEFLDWKRNYELKKHWLAHTKKICLRCNLPIIKKYTGRKKRRSFFCKRCQSIYK
ncbi:MAG TPA: DNA-formamidopyrimidine glycosylase family protein [Bacteroidia bacterium]|jgi:endonuclease-8|nr:DNA-formamidopyrimidine glycosylase family protein [Bacteroidia bacterium]